MARPKPKNMEAKIEKVLEYISDGMSNKKACEIVGIDRKTFTSNVDKNIYARAREERADYYFEQIKDMAFVTFKGKRKVGDKEEIVDAQNAKVAIDALKWVVGRMHIKYSDRINQESTKEPNNILPLYNVLPDGFRHE